MHESDGSYCYASVLMDPELYKALGRQQGWDDESLGLSDYYKDGVGMIMGDGPSNTSTWAYHKARALAANDDGGSAEDYLISVLR